MYIIYSILWPSLLINVFWISSFVLSNFFSIFSFLFFASFFPYKGFSCGHFSKFRWGAGGIQTCGLIVWMMPPQHRATVVSAIVFTLFFNFLCPTSKLFNSFTIADKCCCLFDNTLFILCKNNFWGKIIFFFFFLRRSEKVHLIMGRYKLISKRTNSTADLLHFGCRSGSWKFAVKRIWIRPHAYGSDQIIRLQPRIRLVDLDPTTWHGSDLVMCVNWRGSGYITLRQTYDKNRILRNISRVYIAPMLCCFLAF